MQRALDLALLLRSICFWGCFCFYEKEIITLVFLIAQWVLWISIYKSLGEVSWVDLGSISMDLQIYSSLCCLVLRVGLGLLRLESFYFLDMPHLGAVWQLPVHLMTLPSSKHRQLFWSSYHNSKVWDNLPCKYRWWSFSGLSHFPVGICWWG